MPQLDYSSVNRYWNRAQPSMLGPYMMDGFGFPAGAGWFRFKAEQRIVDRLTSQQDSNGRVLNLGCGIGHWATRFADRFSEVVAVEGSQTFYQSLEKRVEPYPNIEAIQANVMDYMPTGEFEVIFLGGLLMHLNEADAIILLQRLAGLLNPGGIILCRESTVRNGSESRQGDYQATYRSEQLYTELFHKSDLTAVRTERNVPYVLLKMGSEIMKFWKSKIPAKLKTLAPVGHLVSGALRLTNPGITRAPRLLGYNFPRLQNYFFLLTQEPERHRSSQDRKHPSTLSPKAA